MGIRDNTGKLFSSVLESMVNSKVISVKQVKNMWLCMCACLHVVCEYKIFIQIALIEDVGTGWMKKSGLNFEKSFPELKGKNKPLTIHLTNIY